MEGRGRPPEVRSGRRPRAHESDPEVRRWVPEARGTLPACVGCRGPERWAPPGPTGLGSAVNHVPASAEQHRGAKAPRAPEGADGVCFLVFSALSSG